jgi:hypothetical protein
MLVIHCNSWKVRTAIGNAGGLAYVIGDKGDNMKVVQVGILAALLVCAGLLYTVYRHQQAPAAPAEQPAAAATAPQPASVPAAETAAPLQENAPEEAKESASTEAPAAVPAHRKPSPSGIERKKHSREEMAQNRQPELISTAPGVQAPAAPVADAPPPAPQQLPPMVNAQPNPPAAPAAPPEPRQPHHVTIPAGTTITIRLADSLSSKKNQPGDVFSGTLDQPLVVDGFAIAERGARVQGKLADVEQAGHLKGASQLSLQLTKVHTSDGQDIAISTEKFTKDVSTPHKEDAKKVGIGAVLGTAIGAIAGGGKGAAIGAGAGAAAGGGAAAATRGKPVELPVETRLTFRIEQPVTVTERLQ